MFLRSFLENILGVGRGAGDGAKKVGQAANPFPKIKPLEKYPYVDRNGNTVMTENRRGLQFPSPTKDRLYEDDALFQGQQGLVPLSAGSYIGRSNANMGMTPQGGRASYFSPQGGNDEMVPLQSTGDVYPVLQPSAGFNTRRNFNNLPGRGVQEQDYLPLRYYLNF